MKENYAQPSLPEGVEADIIKGLYRVSTHGKANAANDVRLVGAGAILPQVMEAAQQLDADWGVATEVWSATSFSELARDAREVERRDRLNPLASLETSHVARSLGGNAPIVAATDYVRAYPQLIASYVDAPFTALGTDGFGRSDTRSTLRSFFEVDSHHVIVAALAVQGRVSREKVSEAIARYGLETDADPPWLR